MPVNMAVRKTTGIESTPRRTIWRTHSRTSKGRRTDHAIVRHSIENQIPVLSNKPMNARPIRSNS